jgi:hypothetical protein
VTHSGALGSENAGTSNRNAGEIPARRKIKVSFATVISEGLVGPKPMAKAGGDGHEVNIPQPAVVRWSNAGYKLTRLIGLASLHEDWYARKIRCAAFNSAIRCGGHLAFGRETLVKSLPRKTSKLQLLYDRTANRHR